MASKRTPDTNSDLTTAVETLHQTVQSLATSAERLRQTVQQPATAESTKAAPATSVAAPIKSPESDEEARRFHERLEQTGQLMDVDENTDLATLPPSVTHVRHPDGRIERIGFSASPYSGS